MPIKNEIAIPASGQETHKRYLITSADDGMGYWLTDTKKVLEKYAEKCGAELIVLPKTKRRNNTWVIFDAWEKSIELGDDHDYVWMDADIFIAEDAPDVFELDDRFFVCQPDPVKRINPKWRKNHKKYNVPNARPYPVTAMVKWSNRHIKNMFKWVNENQKDYPARFGDQEVIASGIYHTETPVFFFPNSWHRMSRWMQKDTKFFHFAGSKKGVKANKIKSFCAEHGIKLNV